MLTPDSNVSLLGRAIYSNTLGFLGGVQWAILVARVCQLYPTALPSMLVRHFFVILLRWNWPNPAMLRNFASRTGITASLTFKEWNPQIYPADRKHIMPILTPAYPSMCATHNVSQSTFKVMQREFQRGYEVTDRILRSQDHEWKELFEEADFFSRYKWYLTVIASSDAEDRMHLWSGTVESKLRLLVGMLEENTPIINYAHPFIKPVEKVHYCVGEVEIREAAAGNSPAEPLHDADTEGVTKVWTTTFFIGLDIVKAKTREFSRSCSIGYELIQCIRSKCRSCTARLVFPGRSVHPYCPVMESVRSTEHGRRCPSRQAESITSLFAIRGGCR